VAKTVKDLSSLLGYYWVFQDADFFYLYFNCITGYDGAEGSDF
jgi:hypothetical protein